jgi:DNA topoisomerase II
LRQVSQFGSRCAYEEKFLKAFAKTDIVSHVLSFARLKAQQQLDRKGGRKTSRLTGIPKLDDANKAGTRDADKCTLILTEGDSAKTLAVSGLGVVGRDLYGVFPLRGKLLNVRDASVGTVTNNTEISAIKRIMGLQHGKKYDNPDERKRLRYGHLMIMTDQDHDGSHIKVGGPHLVPTTASLPSSPRIVCSLLCSHVWCVCVCV